MYCGRELGMLAPLLACLMLGQLLVPVMGQQQHANCSQPTGDCSGRLSANGCCGKGCVRNELGKCVAEKCTSNWTGWLRRPVTMSCYFHWFLLIFAAVVLLLVAVVLALNVAFEVRDYRRKRRMNRYVRFSTKNGPSSTTI